MARLVPTMLPTITPRPRRRASAAMARPSVRPPHLSSLMLTTSNRPGAAGSSASDRIDSSAAIGIGGLEAFELGLEAAAQGLLEQGDVLAGQGFDQPAKVRTLIALVGVDPDPGFGMGGADRIDPLEVGLRLARKLDLDRPWIGEGE